MKNTKKPVSDFLPTSSRNVSYGYRFALLLVAVTIILIALISAHLVIERVNDTPIIVLSGKQRFWSNRIGFLTYQLATEKEENHPKTAEYIKEALDAMEAAHQTLIEKSSTDKDTKTLQDIYFGSQFNLDAKMQSVFSHSHKLLQLATKDITLQQTDVSAILHSVGQELITPLSIVVDYYNKRSIDKFRSLHIIIFSLSGLALFILAAVSIFLLRPAVAYIAQAQQRLLELNRLKGDFLANMSHEIRTPMNGIFGMTELLLDSELNQRQQHYARTLQNSADHLLGLINDILDFSKLEAGHMKLDPIHFNLLATIEDVIEILSSQAREKNLELLLRYIPGIPQFIVADPGRIRQILFNLIGNAIKFTDKGYVIVQVDIVPATHGTANLIISVEDTGIGIPENKINALFEKFMQVETGSTRGRQGTGLGLAISRNLLQLMDGDISVRSLPGKGTTFTCQIPLNEVSKQQAEVDHNALLSGKRILLVDDLEPNRLLFKEVLTAAGVECLVAENASEALSILAYENDSGRVFDLILTDYMMPKIDGLELTNLIKAHKLFHTLPIMILTSSAEHGVIKKFDDAGAVACLTKPVSRRQLLDMLLHIFNAAAKGEKAGIITAKSSVAMTARKLLNDKPLDETHILLVEDNRVNLEITSEILSQFGCQVTSVENGRMAIDAVRNHKFDLIFMDCQMPEMDGFEAARHIVRLVAAGSIAKVPIVALTANALKGDRERCLESGMDDYLCKPVRRTNLEAILLKWLREKLERRAAKMQSVVHLPNSDLILIEDDLSGNETQHDFDYEAFVQARDALGDKLQTVISYYLKDAETYLADIAEAARSNRPDGAILPAHTLKSSSRQFGAIHLANLAEQMEEVAREKAGTGNVDRLVSLLPIMHNALEIVRPILKSSAQS